MVVFKPPIEMQERTDSVEEKISVQEDKVISINTRISIKNNSCICQEVELENILRMSPV